MAEGVGALLLVYRTLKQRRDKWIGYWRELADVFMPMHELDDSSSPGERRGDEIYDGTPRLAARDLAAAIDSLLKSRFQNWFEPGVEIETISRDEDARVWFYTVRNRMMKAIYNPRARFIEASGEADRSLTVFGWGTLWPMENRQRNGLLFRSFPVESSGILVNADGVVEGFFLEESLTAEQAIARWKGNVSGRILEAASKKRKKKFKFVQLILPAHHPAASEFSDTIRNNRFIRYNFYSCVLDVEGEKKIKEEGFVEFPVSAPRWETAPGEWYARAPAMHALPDSETLQAMGKTLLVAGQRVVDPPTWIVAGSAISPVRTFPGGVTVIDPQVLSKIGGNPPIGTLQHGAQIALGREMQQDVRFSVERAFFKDVLNLPRNGPEMTATEVLVRNDEFVRVMGPVFGRLQDDYLNSMIKRVFGIMERAGQFPPRPDILKDVDIKFTFQSPIQRARMQLDVAGLSNTLATMAPLIEHDPTLMDWFNGDRIAQDSPDWAGIPQEWLRRSEDVDGRRQQRAQQAQQEQMVAAAQPVSKAVESLAKAESLARQ